MKMFKFGELSTLVKQMREGKLDSDQQGAVLNLVQDVMYDVRNIDSDDVDFDRNGVCTIKVIADGDDDFSDPKSKKLAASIVKKVQQVVKKQKWSWKRDVVIKQG